MSRVTEQEAEDVLNYPFNLADKPPLRAATAVMNTLLTLSIILLFTVFWYFVFIPYTGQRAMKSVAKQTNDTLDELLSGLPSAEATYYRDAFRKVPSYPQPTLEKQNDDLRSNAGLAAYSAFALTVMAVTIVFLLKPDVNFYQVTVSSGTVLGLLFLTDLYFYLTYEFPFRTVNDNDVSLAFVTSLQEGLS